VLNVCDWGIYGHSKAKLFVLAADACPEAQMLVPKDVCPRSSPALIKVTQGCSLLVLGGIGERAN
jgi:hypothetical protein